MEVEELRPGLWRWTAPHPNWTPEKDKPGGWGQMVGSVYCDARGGLQAAGGASGPGDAVLLIDPLAPPAGTEDCDRFWEALDRDIERARAPVAVLLGNEYHARSAEVVYNRYKDRPGASIWAPEAALGRVACRVTHPFRPDTPLPGGASAHSIGSLSEAEVAYYLPLHRALVVADALIGLASGLASGLGSGTRSGQVRVAPLSWAPETDEGALSYRSEFRPTLRRLLDLHFEILLVSHGPPVLMDGPRALEAALASPAWGD